MNDQDLTPQLQEQVATAAAGSSPLRIVGGDSKAFYGRAVQGTPLHLSGHRGIVDYEPTELVLSARAGTPLREIEKVLAEHNQMLPFEPPYFGETATLGGTVACNLSGPRRPYAGAARDFVLGTRVLNGKAEVLKFGGEVMKNVAGYDVSRLMAGALGTLGAVLEVSLKVLPRSEAELTLSQELALPEALDRLHEWARLPLPLSASAYEDGRLYLRLSGANGAVSEARAHLGGDEVADAEAFWHTLKEQQRPFFDTEQALWRLSVASDAAPPALDGEWLYEWGGAQRWLRSTASEEEIRAAAQALGGHATLFRGGARDEVFQPLTAGLLNLHKNLKQAFDPHGIFNPGRMYADV